MVIRCLLDACFVNRESWKCPEIGVFDKPMVEWRSRKSAEKKWLKKEIGIVFQMVHICLHNRRLLYACFLKKKGWKRKVLKSVFDKPMAEWWSRKKRTAEMKWLKKQK